MYTGQHLIAWGLTPSAHFKSLLTQANKLAAEGRDEAEIKKLVLGNVPAAPTVLKRRIKGDYAVALDADTPEEQANLAAVRLHMDELMRTPMIEHGIVMPDACPASTALGTIPVGGAVASRAIHPAFHSGDICCSMHVSLYPAGTDTSTFMDALQASTRFGPGSRRPEHWVPDPITDELTETRNPFLIGLEHRAKAQLADQGDGNHFSYVGRLSVAPLLTTRLAGAGREDLASALAGHSDVIALVSHHGSRDLGAQVYKRGLEAAVAHTRKLSPDTPPHQAWLDPDSDQGAAYWEAMGYVARWTKRNHELVHARTAARLGIEQLAAFGNEHNFVWKRDDGLYHHGKGATPAWRDASGHPLLGVISLNMAEPILLVLGRDNKALGSFAPHGAGRNKSRTQLLREMGLKGLEPATFLARSTQSWPSRPKDWTCDSSLTARTCRRRRWPTNPQQRCAIRSSSSESADIIGEIRPLGCLMAGDYDKPWMVKKAKRADLQADAT